MLYWRELRHAKLGWAKSGPPPALACPTHPMSGLAQADIMVLNNKEISPFCSKITLPKCYPKFELACNGVKVRFRSTDEG